MLKIALQPSHILAGILSLAHGGTLGILWLIDLPLAVQLGASIMVLYGWTALIRRHALLRGPDAVIALEVTPDHLMNIETRAAGWQPCEVLGTTYVTASVSILNLRMEGATRNTNVTLLSDSLHADDFRKLRTWLRWKQERADKPHVP